MSRRGDCSRGRGRAWFALASLCAFVTGCTAQSGDGEGVDVRDFSEFIEFAFSRDPGLGFCPLFDAVFDVTILLNEDGQYVASISALVGGVAGEDECLDSLGGVPIEDIWVLDGEPVECAVLTQYPELTLTAEQADAVIVVFSEVVLSGPDPFCSGGSIDPCRIDTFTFDSFEVSTYPCGDLRIPGSQASLITDLLEDLRDSAAGT